MAPPRSPGRAPAPTARSSTTTPVRSGLWPPARCGPWQLPSENSRTRVRWARCERSGARLLTGGLKLDVFGHSWKARYVKNLLPSTWVACQAGLSGFHGRVGVRAVNRPIGRHQGGRGIAICEAPGLTAVVPAKKSPASRTQQNLYQTGVHNSAWYTLGRNLRLGGCGHGRTEAGHRMAQNRGRSPGPSAPSSGALAPRRGKRIPETAAVVGVSTRRAEGAREAWPRS